MKRVEVISMGAALELHKRADAELLLTKPAANGWDVQVIRFASRAALEAFNRGKNANLRAVVLTQVPRNCVAYRHQSDSEARLIATA